MYSESERSLSSARRRSSSSKPSATYTRIGSLRFGGLAAMQRSSPDPSGRVRTPIHEDGRRHTECGKKSEDAYLSVRLKRADRQADRCEPERGRCYACGEGNKFPRDGHVVLAFRPSRFSLTRLWLQLGISAQRAAGDLLKLELAQRRYFIAPRICRFGANV